MISETTTLLKVGKIFYLGHFNEELIKITTRVSYLIHYETASGRIDHPPAAMPFPKRHYCKVQFSNTDPSMVFFCFRLSVAEEHEFIKDYLTEMKGFDLDKESLIVYNFGYNRPLPFPAIALTPNTNMTFNLQTSGIHAQSRRSIAVVGEKYVGRFVEIMLVVDRLHEESQGLPSDIFLQSEHGIKLENMSSHHMHEAPSLVGTFIISFVQKSRTHTEANE